MTFYELNCGIELENNLLVWVPRVSFRSQLPVDDWKGVKEQFWFPFPLFSHSLSVTRHFIDRLEDHTDQGNNFRE